MEFALPHALPKSPTHGERLGWWVTQYHSPCRGDLENYQLWCPPSTHLPARGRSGATREPSRCRSPQITILQSLQIVNRNISTAVLRSDKFGTGHRLGIQNAPAGGPLEYSLQITYHLPRAVPSMSNGPRTHQRGRARRSSPYRAEPTLSQCNSATVSHRPPPSPLPPHPTAEPVDADPRITLGAGIPVIA